MSLLDLLTAGKVDEFNMSRGERTRLDFFAADLAGVKLPGVDLSGANVEKADLSDCSLAGASLYRTRLTGIDGSNLDMTEALANRCRLEDAWLENAVLDDADFSQATLREAYLVGSRGRGVRFTGAKLTEADARDVVWPMADLAEASLHKANLAGADLAQADLTEANATSADFTGARLDGAIASRAKLQGATLTGASLVAARLDEAHLAEADLSGADLSGADLTGANLTGAVLTGATLAGAVLAGAVLDGVDLSGLDLEDVDLTGVDPTALGLSEAQLAQVAAVGSPADPNAPLVIEEARAAACGEHVLVFWENADNEVERSLRWLILGVDGVKKGILPIGTDGLLAKAVAGVADGFELLVLQERPGGVSLLAYRIGVDGSALSSRTEPLGFTPALAPIARAQGDAVLMWGMARRGPTLVVQRLDAEGLTPVHSERVATARGFLGRHLPVVSCKGDVWMAVGVDGAARPLGSPEGFPGIRGAAAPVGDRVVAVWATAPKRNRPGTLAAAWLAKRGQPEIEDIAATTLVAALDVLPVGDDVWVAWADLNADGVAVWRARVGDAPMRLDVDLEDVADVRFAPGPLDAAAGPSVVVVGTMGQVIAFGPAGQRLAAAGGV